MGARPPSSGDLIAPARTSLETPSGKDASYENFPVGSWLLPRHLRPHIAVFYNFARAIDDIADNPTLSADDKLLRLEAFDAAIVGGNSADPALATAHRMRTSLATTKVSPDHCRDLITAFKQDAVKHRYADWQDLIAYCRLSAAPVGRYLLDLHGGSEHGYAASDALCKALQVINHLQDCQEDYRLLDRVYLPQDWLQKEGTGVEELDAPVASPGMRRVLDLCLDATADLLIEARRLPGGLRSRRLALESAVIVDIAQRLVELLRQRDPLAGRVALSKAAYASCLITGVCKGLLAYR